LYDKFTAAAQLANFRQAAGLVHKVQTAAGVEYFCRRRYDVGKSCADFVTTHGKVVETLHFATTKTSVRRIAHHDVHKCVADDVCGLLQISAHDFHNVAHVVELHVACGDVGKLLLYFHRNKALRVLFVRNKQGNYARPGAEFHASFARHIRAQNWQAIRRP